MVEAALLQNPTELRDPIHGFVRLYRHERRIIDTFEFQRLRRVHQLGLTHYIFHGAEHSRFGHSIGVMHIAGTAVENVLEKNIELVKERLNWSENQVLENKTRLICLARLSGLLHDVGHAPFSHTGEKRLFPEGVHHEDLSAAIIKQTQIGDIIDQDCGTAGISKENVADIVTGQATMREGFLQELITSPWDADKMDYLLRDSHYCGVQYGKFDLGRILNTLTLDSENPGGELTLAIEDGGFHALEEFVLARYFMFTQVYFHDVRRAFDLILTDFISELLGDMTENGRYPGPDALEDYLKWDDVLVLAAASERRQESTHNTAWRIINRQHPKLVYETSASPDAGLARKVLYTLPQAAQENFAEDTFWMDQAIDHPDPFGKADIMIKYPGTPPNWRSFKTESRALSGLEDVGQVRLYANVRGDQQKENEIINFCRTYMA